MTSIQRQSPVDCHHEISILVAEEFVLCGLRGLVIYISDLVQLSVETIVILSCKGKVICRQRLESGDSILRKIQIMCMHACSYCRSCSSIDLWVNIGVFILLSES